jgi:hypothetical protein
MKSYTDLEQSKKLAEILPIESADMRYGYIVPYDFSDRMYDGGYDEIPYSKDFLTKNPNFSANEYDAELPCWSLAALLGVLPDVHLKKYIYDGITKYYATLIGIRQFNSEHYDNPIDACYDMIIHLYELNLL